MLEPLEHQEGLIRAWWLLTLVHLTNGRYGEAESAAERMIHHARRAGDRVIEARLIPALVTCSLYGPHRPGGDHSRAGPPRRNGRRPEGRGIDRVSIAHLEAMRGDFDKRSLRKSARSSKSTGGGSRRPSPRSTPDRSRSSRGTSTAPSKSSGAITTHSTRWESKLHLHHDGALLAEALYRQGKLDEAEGYTVLGWRRSRHPMTFRPSSSGDPCGRGSSAAAAGWRWRVLARAALKIIRTSDEPDSQAEGLLALAEGIRALGRGGRGSGCRPRRARALRSQGQSDLGGALDAGAEGP